jgi:hypothetical protein
MLQKKHGTNITPLDVATDSSYFFSNTAYMLHSGLNSHGFSIYSGNNSGVIRNNLSQGKPVIVHLRLNSGDGHYIVLKSIKGDSYLINDPWEGPDLDMSKYYSTNLVDQVITYNR